MSTEIPLFIQIPASEIVQALNDLIHDINRIEAGQPATPQMFGAKGDGQNNDTAALQAAIATGNCYIPPGTYFCNASFIVPSNATIRGAGDRSYIKFRNNGSAFSITGKSNILIEDLKVDNDRAVYTSTGANGIFVDWTTIAGADVTIKNVTVKNFAGAGIIALASVGTPSTNLTIVGCQVDTIGAHGIISQDYISSVEIRGNRVSSVALGVSDRPGITASRNGTGVIVTDNICIGSPSSLGTSTHGISVDSSIDVICNGNACIGWSHGFGVEVGFVTNGVFSGNTILNCSYGVGVSGIQGQIYNTNIAITGNTISGCSNGIFGTITGGDGTAFQTNFTISGNTVSNSTGIGISLTLFDGVSVVGNTIVNSGQSGLYLTDCIGKLIAGNTIRKNNILGLKTVTSITRSAGTATVVCASHGYSTNDFVNIFGASPADFNVVGQVTVVDPNTFTYAVNSGMVGTTAAGSRLQCAEVASLAHSGVFINQIALTDAKEALFGENLIELNGLNNIYNTSYSGGYGFFNDWLILRGAPANLPVANLTSGIPANALDRVGIGIKTGKFVIAHNQAGTTYYLTIPLDGTTSTFTNSTTPP